MQFIKTKNTHRERKRESSHGRRLQQRVASPRRTTCRSSGDNINGRDRRENGESVARGVIQKNERRDDGVDEVDGIELGSRKRKCREGVCPLCRVLLGAVVAVVTTDAP